MSTIFLQNKIAVISGGSGYVGSQVAKTLSEEGMIIAILSTPSSREKAESSIVHLSGTGHKVYVCDIRNGEMVEQILSNIERELGPVYVAIHTAGEKPLRKKLYLTTEKEMKEQVDSTIMGGFHFLTECARRLKNNKGGILIGLTTAGVIFPAATQSLGAYIPAKYALHGMLIMLREEMFNYGVAVHSVAPGFMAGGMNSDIPKAFVDMIRIKGKTKELMTAEKIAKRILDICSDGQKYLNQGTILMAPEYD